MGIRNKINKLVKEPKKTIRHKYYRIDYSIGKSLFKNTSGLQNNLLGSLQNISQKSPKSEAAKELKKNGFYKLGKIYDEHFFNSIKSKFNKMIENDKYAYTRVECDGYVLNRQLHNDPCPIPEFEKLLNDHIKNLMSDYFVGNWTVKRILATRNYYVPSELRNKEFYSDHWHCDARDVDNYWKAFILLSDVNDDDGPLHLHPRERTKELIKKGFGTRDDYKLSDDILYDPKYLVKHTGSAGTVVIANPALCLHRAGIPAQGRHRDMIYLIIGRSDKPLDDNWMNHQDADHKYN